MTTSGPRLRRRRSDETREAILSSAEQLFALHGIIPVTNRQISEAARQGNNAAVSYHFGTKADLVRAIERKHAGAILALREQKLEVARKSTDLRDWVACLIWPLTDHLEALGNPTWYARFAAQAMADPVYHRIVTKEALTSPTMVQVVEGINRCLPHLPPLLLVQRNIMARNLLMHTCADYERGLAEGRQSPCSDWQSAGAGLLDAIVGLWLAPVSPVAERHHVGASVTI